MVVLAGVLLALLSAIVAGGRIAALAGLRFHSAWLLVAALGLQLLVVSFAAGAGAGWHAPVHVASYGLAAAFVVRNRHVPWLWLVATGGLMNAAAILANGGVMPASPSAVELAGLAAADGFANSAVVEGARLAFLGDVFAVPDGYPLANVFSAGDAIIVLGVLVLAHRVSRPLDAPRVDVDARGEVAAGEARDALDHRRPHVQLHLLRHAQAVVHDVGEAVAAARPRLDAEQHVVAVGRGAPLDLAGFQMAVERREAE